MLRDVIRQYALTQPDRPAVVSIGKNALCYAELDRQIEAIGLELRRGGLGSDKRIGVALLDGPEAILAILAVASHAAAVPINNSLSADELRQVFEHADLDAIVLTATTPAHIRRVASDFGALIIEATTGKGAEIACTVRAPVKHGATPTEPSPQSIALILQTSGTTGVPKLVPITHGNLLSEAAKMRDWFNLTPEDRCLSSLPLYYAHGLREVLFPPIITGGSIARPVNHTDLNIAEWLSELEPTWYSTFPIFHRAIFELIAADGGSPPPHKLRFILSAGTPLKPELQEGLERTFDVPVLEFYGMGEAGHMTANLPGRCKPGTCGMPLPGDMMIAYEGNPVPAGEIGEVHVRGPTVVSSYLNNPHVNREVFVDGWFRTGDLGSFDADGFLSIHGRYKELINRGGEKLSPIEVEQVLLRHPAVADAAAFGIPHPRLGEDVAAAVVLHPGQATTSSDLQSFVRGYLAPFKVPRLLTIMRDLPKDVTGKIQRRELAATMAADAAALTAVPSLNEAYCPLTAALVRLWCDLLQIDSIGLDDDFFAKGGDSLLAVQMRLAVEKLTGLPLPDTLPFDAPTIRQLSQAVTESNQTKPTPVLIEWSDSKVRRPFFYFHGDFISGGHYVRRLAELLGPTARFISVAPHGLGREPMPASVEQMARDRLPLILAAQPTGPFRLGGHCNGGAVAFEVARLLQAAGHRVELVALLSVPTMNAGLVMRSVGRVLDSVLRVAVRDVAAREAAMTRGMELVWLVYEKHRRFWQTAPPKRWAKLAARANRYRDVLRQWIGSLPSEPVGSRHSSAVLAPDFQSEVTRRLRWYFRALAMYFPRPCKTPVVHYSASHNGRYLKRICPQLEIVTVPTDHFACITTHVEIIADHLRKRLSGHVSDVKGDAVTAAAALTEGQLTT